MRCFATPAVCILRINLFAFSRAIAAVFTQVWQSCAQTDLSAARKYIMGTQNPQIISENIVLIADSNTWIEGNAIQQLQTTARLP